MQGSQRLNITLPADLVQAVESKIRGGLYADESAVIQEGLRALLAREQAEEHWLRDQVAPAYDAMKADPSQARSVDQVRARLAAEHAKQR